jgi:aspartate racemase
MAEHLRPIYEGDWKSVADLLLKSARNVVNAGADFAICPDNTCHGAFPYLVGRSPLPWLHIAEVVAEEAARSGFKQLGILGTKYLMEGSVYRKALKALGIATEIPEEIDRDRINTIIFDELVNAVFTERTRLYFNQIMEELKTRGCDAAVLGCTEIPLVVRSEDTPLPVLDSTRLLARAAIRRSLAET